MPKYPVKEFHQYPEEVEGPFRPEFKFDSRGRLILPLPGFSKMALEVRPGSKKTSFQPEDETEGTPMIYPGTIKTGALHASTVLTVGDKDGWRVQISGQEAEYPIVYTDGEIMKFYVDKQGTVYVEGTIKASAGEIGGWSISTGAIVELYAGSGATRVGLRPGSWPFYAGADDPTAAPARINQAGQAWFTSIELLGGAGVGDLALLDQVGNLQIVDLAVTEEKLADAAVEWDKIKSGAVRADHLITSEAVITLSAQIQTAVILNAHIGDAEIQSAKIDSLDANKINVGTLTGFTIQTATSGQRIALEGAGGPYGLPHEILVYPASGTPMEIYGGASYFYFIANLAAKSIRFENPYGLVALQINEASIYVPGNITVGGTVDGINISTHAANASAHHSKYTDANARSAVTDYNLPGDLDLNVHDVEDVRYLKFNSSYGRIYWGTDLVVDFYQANAIWGKHLIVDTVADDLNIGSDNKYWNEINYKYLTDRGCLGDFSKGVRLLNGEMVSDVEALQRIGKKRKMTAYGVPMLDYKTMPKAVYRPATSKDGVDGAEMGALISIMIGSIKELDNRLKKVET